LRWHLFRFQSGGFQPVANSLPNVDISVIHQDRSGQLWLGTQAGLARREGSGWKLFTVSDGLAGNEVRAICSDAETNLWIATGTGLSRLRDGHFTTFRKSDGMPSDDLSCLYPGRDGALWIGTRGSGLARLINGKWNHYTTRDGLIGNSISYIIEDGETNFWIGSNAGLMRVPKQSLDDLALGKVEGIVCRAYTESDGLPTRECTQGSQPAACRAADGTLYFPMTRGAVFVQPTKLHKNLYQPPVIIESVLVENVEQVTNRLRALPLEAIVVPPGKEHLEIRFTSLNLGAAERSRFRYRLNGHETAWNEVGNVRIARYPKLSPHDYTFEVAAANEDGVWSSVATTLLIQVKPPFYRTGWFISVASIALLGLIVGTVHYFSTQKLHRELAVMKQHEELEKERARIARDLHDQLGANLMQVALLGELAEVDKDQPGEVEEHAKQIYQTARETTKALDEIVWAVNPSNDTLDGLVNYICKYAQEYYELAGLKYRIDVPSELPDVTLPPEVRHNVFLAAKEAVNNVVKHAQASSAWLRLKLESDHVTFEIEDDGRGLADMNEKTGRNGLRNMRKRLEDVGGSFSIEPAREKGALVRMKVPIKKS
jgi:signal transduction histidine kinase